MPKKLHPAVKAFIDQSLALTGAKKTVLVTDDSSKEALIALLVKKGTLIPLKAQGSYLARTDPLDTARVEERTFICTKREKDAGPNNHHVAPSQMKKRLEPLFSNCMEGDTAYVIFFSMGPQESPLSLQGIEITDSAYVVLNMLLMTRVNQEVFEKINQTGEFISCLHATGHGNKMASWPCDPENMVIAHFPETKEIFSYGSGYGGNALLGKKAIALRLASYLFRKDQKLAEHMLIIKVTSPEGVSKGIMAAFPSSCGKTNLALMRSKLPGWKVECVGDDIAWIEVRPDGFYAMNPEMGFFGIASGTNELTNPVAMETIASNTIYTNCALTPEGQVWWDKKTDEIPQGLIDWKGQAYKDQKQPAAHPNSRFTVSIQQCPSLAEEFKRDQPLKIDAILFGGRRDDTFPLVLEASSYQMGVLFGAMLSSKTTAAAKGQVGKVRHDPFAMLPFAGYHMGSYFAHWLDVKKAVRKHHLPRFFYVNWFLTDSEGNFAWPGFQENMRVIEWIFRRLEHQRAVSHTPVGNVPVIDELTWEGLNIDPSRKKQLFNVDSQKWKEELKMQREYLSQFDPQVPEMLYLLIDKLLEQLEEFRS
jgi:phosphoenolpyruvate carboxykinase (GTP)